MGRIEENNVTASRTVQVTVALQAVADTPMLSVEGTPCFQDGVVQVDAALSA